nr:hypothetical protein [uncultured Mucilaginibacter sp.]
MAEEFLSGGDLRSIGNSDWLAAHIKTQSKFDELFNLLAHRNRLIAMRAADAVEKITVSHPQFLNRHKNKIFELCAISVNKELKWHLALLMPRLPIDGDEAQKAWGILAGWALDNSNSRIVRVNAIQALYELTVRHALSSKYLDGLLSKLATENIPSINARIKKVRRLLRA